MSLTVAESIRHRLKHIERRSIGVLFPGVHPPGLEWHLNGVSSVSAGLFHGSIASQNNQISQRDLGSAWVAAAEARLEVLKSTQHPIKLSRIVDLPVVLRLQPDSRTVSIAATV